VVAIVNYILERPAEDFNYEAADVNRDQSIDVSDVVMVVNIILGKDPAAGARARAFMEANGFIF
jgi:hypothetical protein